MFCRDPFRFRPILCCRSLFFANHPGGTLSPSPEDVQLTRRLVDIFDPLNIKVLDHIIIAGNGYISLAESGNLPNVAEKPSSYESIPLRAMERSDWPIQEDELAFVNDNLNDEWER